jgi:hypothetical protein
MYRFILIVLLGYLGVSTAVAQFSIATPSNRVVYQRTAQNDAAVPIAGRCPQQATRIEAQAVPIGNGQGSPSGWVTVDSNPQNGFFQGMIILRGGWYRLDVRVWAGNDQIASGSVDRVGVGEVFIVAGQSNAAGGFQPTPGAADDRVSVVDYGDSDLTESNFPLMFSHADAGRRVGPYNPLYIWGMLGDRLAQRLNVPILFYGAAYGGANSNVWRISANGQNPGGSPGALLFPYRCIGAALEHYVRRTGVRGILWHQGESDNGYQSEQAYFDNVKTVINQSRQQSGFGRLPWMVSRVSFINNTTDPNIINAQNRLIQQLDQVFAGPATDDLIGPDNRFDGLHFGGQGLTRLTDRWDQSLSSSFFSQSVPNPLVGQPPVVTTGYVLPVGGPTAGQAISIPYLKNWGYNVGGDQTAQLLNANGDVLQTLGTGGQNPLVMQLPGSLATGTYRVRVSTTNPATPGTVSPPFSVQGTTSQPPTTTPANTIASLGYKYDAPTHGFNFLVNADGAVEVRLERVDGPFSDTGWYPASPDNSFTGYNRMRFYPPITPGQGGVLAGQYRLSARIIGLPDTEMAAVVTLQNGTFPANGTTTPTTTNPPTTPTTPTVADGIRRMGYKYDAPTHGFQLLVDAGLSVEVRLERLDGPFADNNWQPATAHTGEGDYPFSRFYAPLSPGVGGVEAGKYRLSARITGQPITAVSVDVVLQYGIYPAFTADPTTTPTTPTSPTITTPPATTGAAITKLGYKYDVPTHGFQALADATSSVEIKLERLDGPFSPSDWGAAVANNSVPGYGFQRFYAPITPGVGGVEAGKYRITARLAGQPNTELSVEVTLQYGVFTVYPLQTIARQSSVRMDDLLPKFSAPRFVAFDNCPPAPCIPIRVERVR